MQRLINTAEAAEICCLSLRTMERLRCTGGGPRFNRLRGSVRYRVEEIERWIASREVGSTSETVETDR